MSLNIKNPHATDLIRRLSEKTGESLTGALIGAVEEKLKRLEEEQSREARYAGVMAIAEECRNLWEPGGITAEDLYDSETGLPK